MNKPKKIESTPENWDDGVIGDDKKYASLADDSDFGELFDSLALKMISIRLKQELIDDLKIIAAIEGTGYQPLIKTILQRFVDSEIRKYWHAESCNRLAELQEDDAGENIESRKSA